MPIVLTTKRLQIRRFTLDDAPFILTHVNEPSFIENIRDSGVRTLADAEKYLREGPLHSYVVNGFGLCLVTLRAEGTAIGMCGLLQRPHLESPDIGFALDPPWWGQGYALEAAQAVMRHGFETLGCREILAITSPGNERSARLLLRLGMEDRGVLEQPDDPVRLFGLTTGSGAPSE